MLAELRSRREKGSLGVFDDLGREMRKLLDEAREAREERGFNVVR